VSDKNNQELILSLVIMIFWLAISLM
jgi:hypothetical protein